MKQALLVFLGGGLGSVARYWLSLKLNNFENAIPYGTLLANILGSLIIGFILGYSSRTGLLSENQSLLLATGFCGGFTTFSTFAYENHLYIKGGDYFSFLPYMAVTFVLAIGAVFLGMYLSKLV
ncbi:fluoride efflux transporter CrcB [Lutimonas halocynthiae]|uniref:fluoride efflux transporter CrcB n=1 Tax=Lutimonas halocynthiae TaxID=1446477 RepID=UPI0025B55B80|nr:fluoride efflux transporter CrcB [Lutimonas halocynthiae]MDN3642163.1 fluoride efflux transporter CrcB [Lutimonas halocynthiae]